MKIKICGQNNPRVIEHCLNLPIEYQGLIFYEKSLEIDDTLPESWLGIGVVRDLNNEPHQAIKFIKKAIELDSENPEYWYLYAEILTKQKKIKKLKLLLKR